MCQKPKKVLKSTQHRPSLHRLEDLTFLSPLPSLPLLTPFLSLSLPLLSSYLSFPSFPSPPLPSLPLYFHPFTVLSPHLLSSSPLLSSPFLLIFSPPFFLSFPPSPFHPIFSIETIKKKKQKDKIMQKISSSQRPVAPTHTQQCMDHGGIMCGGITSVTNE